MDGRSPLLLVCLYYISGLLILLSTQQRKDPEGISASALSAAYWSSLNQSATIPHFPDLPSIPVGINELPCILSCMKALKVSCPEVLCAITNMVGGSIQSDKDGNIVHGSAALRGYFLRSYLCRASAIATKRNKDTSGKRGGRDAHNRLIKSNWDRSPRLQVPATKR